MLLSLTGITKSFGDVKVLKGVDLQVNHGELVGLVGENGAGKSTLMNILGGVFEASSGAMCIDDNSYFPKSTFEALKEGVAFIHQELNLFPNLTVLENIFLGRFPMKNFIGLKYIDRKRAYHKTISYLEEVGLDISPHAIVGDLTAAQQQMVEIAKALSLEPKIIIFDEPTTALTSHEANVLFTLIEKLSAKGIGMIYISHNLDDIMKNTKSLFVLRDGELISNGLTKDYTIKGLVREMVGRDMNQFFPKRTTTPKTLPLLQVQRLSDGFVKKVSFTIKKQEVLGFYGLVGSGRSEIARLIYGLDKMKTGRINWKGEQVENLSPNKWISKGVAFLTENRQEEGLMVDNSIEKNIQLAALPTFSITANRVDYSKIRSRILELAKSTHIKYNSLTDQYVSKLSGGNQQKVVLSKWLLTDPDLLILDEPTKGIDIGAKHEIYTLINSLVFNGSSIFLISSEIEELLGLCDRIIVVNQGKIVKEFEKDQFDRTAILESAVQMNSLKVV